MQTGLVGGEGGEGMCRERRHGKWQGWVWHWAATLAMWSTSVMPYLRARVCTFWLGQLCMQGKQGKGLAKDMAAPHVRRGKGLMESAAEEQAASGLDA